MVLAVLLENGAPDAVLLVPGFVIGFSYLSVGSLVRARWSKVLAGQPELATAYSLESVLDEVIFVVGPLVATIIATHADPVIVLYVCCALLGVGAAVAVGPANDRAAAATGRRPAAPVRVAAARGWCC